MAQHGYLGENYGSEYDPDYDPDLQDRSWRRPDDRERGAMFTGPSDIGEWFGGRDSNESWRSGHRHSQRPASAHPDDHYRSWRDKQLEAMDREYAEFCRERERQFHSDFDTWRQNRQRQREHASAGQPLELTDPASQSGDVQAAGSPTGNAALGTNNPANSSTARGRG